MQEPGTSRPVPDQEALEALLARARASHARADELQRTAALTISISEQLRGAQPVVPGPPARFSRTTLTTSRYARLLARLASMPAIEQAKGILVELRGCTPDEAFDLLRQASQRSNKPVRQLAESIIAEVTKPGA